MGERRGRRAVGGWGDMDAAGREASNGASSSSAFGGRIGGCMVVLCCYAVVLLCFDHMQIVKMYVFIEIGER
jgi:hypothetical protein